MPVATTTSFPEPTATASCPATARPPTIISAPWLAPSSRHHEALQCRQLPASPFPLTPSATRATLNPMVVACIPGASIPVGSLSPHHNGLFLYGDAVAVSHHLDKCSPICHLPDRARAVVV